MKKLVRKSIAATLSISLLLGTFGVFKIMDNEEVVYAQTETKKIMSEENDMPKYIFLFIGDGMSYPQITAAQDYLGTLEHEHIEDVRLGFTQFESLGNATTYDATSFAPDSASTATSIATGEKTHSGVVNMDITKTIPLEAISEKLKEQLGYEIGIVSNAGINHATPAAFYAHQESRNNYYEIGEELITSDFDYFGCGGIKKFDDDGRENLYDLAEENGYSIYDTKESILNIDEKDDKVIAISPTLEWGALPYAIDLAEDDLDLADFTRKGIEVLDKDKGFFMMVESGKIDWAGHANDAMTIIQETVAFDEAIQEAYEFYLEHPEDTLILVTGDHETGGLSVGYAGTGYSTYLDVLENQKMSGTAYDSIVGELVEKEASFEEVLVSIEEVFGLTTDEEANELLQLTDREYNLLLDAYEVAFAEEKVEYTEDMELLYGGYNPITVTTIHILNNKAGIDFTSYAHTALPVPVYAQGKYSEKFVGSYDNTNIFDKLVEITNVK